MRRQTTKEPSGPATRARARPASRACNRKSAMVAVRAVDMGLLQHHAAVQVVGMVVTVLVDGQAAGIATEQLDERRVATDLLRMAGAADMTVQAHHLIGGAHHQRSEERV